MKPEAQRIAIAEACGWTVEKHRTVDGISWTALLSPNGKVFDTTSGEATLGNFGGLPSYLTDLNACHEMEKVLTRYWSEHGRYYEELKKLCGYEPRCCATATAAKRAEAFLRTIGKWEESA